MKKLLFTTFTSLGLIHYNKDYVGATLWLMDSSYKIKDEQTRTHFKFIKRLITYKDNDIIKAHNIAKYTTNINKHCVVYPNNQDKITNCGMIANAIPAFIGAYPILKQTGMPKKLEHDIYTFVKMRGNYFKSDQYGHTK